MDDILTIDEAAALLGLSAATVKRRCRTGEIKATRVGRSWVVDALSLPKRSNFPVRTRRPAAASGSMDLEKSLKQLQAQDLKRDMWVPDVLAHGDDLMDRRALLDAVAIRIDDPSEPFDPPSFVPVPKSPFFPRNATNLTLVDRLCYHAVVAAFSPLLDAALPDSVYSARLAGEGPFLLRNGRDAWVRWRDDILASIDDDDVWVAETDITSFFDFVKHELLLPELQAAGVDPRLISRLREMLRTWTVAPNMGVPQGPDASRILANYYMLPVDEAMGLIVGVRYFRFMDDIRLVGTRSSDVVRALHELDNECRRRGLALSTKKTEIRSGHEARKTLEDSELDAVQYAFDRKDDDPKGLRRDLKRLFVKALRPNGHIEKRHATFSLWRLFQARDRSVLNRVLDHLESVSILGWLVPAYITPWIRKPAVQRKITAYLTDRERNLSPYLSTWLMAAMLEVADAIPEDWVNYARSVGFDRDEPVFHRALALNVVATGRSTRDMARLEEIVNRDHDPELVRAACVALFRVGRLTKATQERALRIRGLSTTFSYLKGRSSLPSLIFAARHVPVIR